MEITECYWERRNIGASTIEITVQNDDQFDREIFDEVNQQCQYCVVKVPMSMIDFNKKLSEMSFVLVETQITVKKDLTKKDWFIPQYEDISFEKVVSVEDLPRITKKITPNMFSTDRITLDNVFGPQLGRNRYVNWINTEISLNRSQIAIVRLLNDEVGFMMFREENENFILLLNGLYKEWQNRRMGIITPGMPLMFTMKNNSQSSQVITNISSNNIPVVKLYSRMGYEVQNMSYVFIKHN